MMKKSTILNADLIAGYLTVVAVLQFPLHAFAGDEDPVGSKSAKQSRKDGLFVSEIKMTPETFLWGGHSITLSEAWLEHRKLRESDNRHLNDDQDQLCMKFKVDGQPEYGCLQNPILDFVTVRKEPNLRVSYIIRSASRRGRMQHLIVLPKSRIGSDIELYPAIFDMNVSTNHSEKCSDQVIRFSLSQP
jgi:hypothetical protein